MGFSSLKRRPRPLLYPPPSQRLLRRKRGRCPVGAEGESLSPMRLEFQIISLSQLITVAFPPPPPPPPRRGRKRKRSFRLGARCLDDGIPERHLVIIELLGRLRCRIVDELDCEFLGPRHQIGLLQRLVEGGVQSVDDRPRRAGG